MSLREKKSPLNFFTQLGIQLVWFPDCKCVPFANLFAPVLFGGSAFERQAALKDYRAEPIWFRCRHQQLAPPAFCRPAAADAMGTQRICPSPGSLRLRGCGGPRAVRLQFGSFRIHTSKQLWNRLLRGASLPVQPPGWCREAQCDHASFMRRLVANIAQNFFGVCKSHTACSVFLYSSQRTLSCFSLIASFKCLWTLTFRLRPF